jgi:geranylgeranyl reductase family protein
VTLREGVEARLKSDVAIVGAGPAGSAAAYFLARDGVDVLLLDQSSFPRDKVCGDGVGSRALAVMERMGLGPWVRSNDFLEPETMLLAAPNGQIVTRSPDRREFSYGHVIPRVQLDRALLDRAMTAGARVVEGVKVVSLERLRAGGVRLLCQGKNKNTVRVEARLVVAADGAHASFTRNLGLIRRPPDLLAMRAYFDGVRGDPTLLEVNYERAILPGYGWIFPIGDGRANVGVGVYASQVRSRALNLKGAFRSFVSESPRARARLSQARLISPARGYPLRTGVGGTIPYADNVLIAGEAASLVSPLTGEGIATALESGELAAQHVRGALESGDFSAPALAAYGRELHRRYGRDHRAACILRRLLSIPWVVNHVIHRAQHDPDFALLIGYIIIGLTSPTAALRPGPFIKILTG